MIRFWYFKKLDRFAVSDALNCPNIEDVMSSDCYTRFDYFRYIPVADLSYAEIHRELCCAPREVCFELTKLCNMNCPVCIADSNPHNSLKLSYEDFIAILQCLDPKIKRITLTGGEPTLLPDLVKFVHVAASKFEGVVLSTNGFCPRKMQRATKGLQNLTVTVSLHGNREVHDNFCGKVGSFDNAFETIRRCLDLGHRVEVLTTAFQEAIQTFPELVNLLSELPIDEHRVNIIKSKGRVLRSCVNAGKIKRVVTETAPKHKITIKRIDQPFLFVASCGIKEQRDGSESR
ncbi:molybdenum cofactor biosynthesis enzyme MoaA [Desulfosalsimonas propionicica]|uniref:Molybdenum cofactor biosynthesis enzyme MoaA n=1 Tax=Desulfosalsimonas propionicica TaxID=332175 RepID=A0A7W0HLE9_9BACT|nr:radical SAM protein [Desulfosalsimonas propionicica]MBA2881916.1 molybdenum cofactor biosynthesis enzyme MoaA [Desulfosalsimonas propionicica]